MLKDQEKRGQEMSQQRHLWNPFWRTSRLGNIFLNCQSKRIPGISAFRLEKFYDDYCHHKYRVNGTGQSLNIKTIKNTLARNLSQYHNTHTHSLWTQTCWNPISMPFITLWTTKAVVNMYVYQHQVCKPCLW
jgi:hypothetical protein